MPGLSPELARRSHPDRRVPAPPPRPKKPAPRPKGPLEFLYAPRYASASSPGGAQAGRCRSSASPRARGVTRQAVTKQLHVLAGAGLVRGARAGRDHVWQIEPARLDEVRRWLRHIEGQWDEALSRLKASLERRAGRSAG
jgi:hypothetical protein